MGIMDMKLKEPSRNEALTEYFKDLKQVKSHSYKGLLLQAHMIQSGGLTLLLTSIIKYLGIYGILAVILRALDFYIFLAFIGSTPVGPLMLYQPAPRIKQC